MQTALVALATAGILPDGPRTSLTSAVLLTHSGIFVHVIFVSIFCHVLAAMWVPEPTLVGPKILVSLKAYNPIQNIHFPNFPRFRLVADILMKLTDPWS